jgi:hypothetical protein
MSDFSFPVTLGGIEFEAAEVPEKVNYGGDHLIGVQQLVGGARQVNPMGFSNSDINLEGLIQGELAPIRSKAFDLFRITALPLIFTYEQNLYEVILKNYTPVSLPGFKIQFNMTLLVVKDFTNPFNSGSGGGGQDFQQAVSSQFQQAFDSAAGVGNAALTASVNDIGTALSAAGEIDNATDEDINEVLTAVNTSLALTNSFIDGNSTGSGLIQDFNTTQLVYLYQTQSILIVMQKNLLLIDGAVNSQITTVAGGNLFDLALKYYGDATQWNIIAEANNLINPFLADATSDNPVSNKLITLIIPPKPTRKTGGIYYA